MKRKYCAVQYPHSEQFHFDDTLSGASEMACRYADQAVGVVFKGDTPVMIAIEGGLYAVTPVTVSAVRVNGGYKQDGE